jgi:hypothetical protein
MEHVPDFHPETLPAMRGSDARARETAGAYARLFASEDGKRVLADLLAKFSPDRPRFHGHSDVVQAAKIDGQADVIREIQTAIKAGTPGTGISPT